MLITRPVTASNFSVDFLWRALRCHKKSTPKCRVLAALGIQGNIVESTSIEKARDNISSKNQSYGIDVFKHSLKYSLISYICSLGIIFTAITLLGGGPDQAGDGISLKDVVLKIIAVPFVETVIFQLCLIWILSKIKFLNVSLVITISAVFFVLSHNFAKAVVVLPLGFILAYLFCHWWKKTGTLKWAFIVTFLTHALHNTYSSFTNFIPPSMFFWL